MKTTVPAKQAVRDFMAARQKQPEPPPSLEEVRRKLGWHLIPANGIAIKQR